MVDNRALFESMFPAGSDRVCSSNVASDAANLNDDFPDADVHVITSDGLRIPAHSHILASVSSVLENTLYDRPRKRGCSEMTIPILGVPSDAVLAFLRYLYSSRCTEEEMDKYGMHLLVLAHVFQVPGLKRACTARLARHVMVENVIDLAKLARECDAPSLFVRCVKIVAQDFRAVEQTEAWRFLQNHDPRLELHFLQYLHEADTREERRKQMRKEQSIYLQLSEAMECLWHICTEGCTDVGPHDRDPLNRSKAPCSSFSTCQGLQLLIRHFAGCEKKTAPGGCCRCKSMWQLLRLHSSICHQPDPCKVPLCKHFKLKAHEEKKGEDGRWRILVRKVVSARVLSSLSKRKIDDARAPKDAMDCVKRR